MHRDWRFIAFLASASAAGVHLGAAREHFAEYAPAGAFMLVAGVLQLAWAAWVSRGASSMVLTAGALGNLGIVAVWVASRTSGLPWGPMPGRPEHIDGPDALATALEILVVLAAGRLSTGEAPAPGSLLRLAWAGALAACILGAHDATREQMTAFATIATAFTMRAFLIALPLRAPETAERGSHENLPSRSRRRAGRLADARPGLDASG